MTQRVLVTEQLADSGLDLLRNAGLEVDVRLGLDPAGLLEAVAGASALIIRSATKVTAEVIAAGRQLVVVGRAGIGLDNVDIEAATRQGVMVVNAPQSNVLSAAEHTMALLLAQARNIPQADADLKGGNWNRTKWEGVELHGKTLGIVGLGRVGVLVAQRALAFGMHLIAFDPFISGDRARQLGVELVGELSELVGRADFVTIHLPKTAETVGLIGREALAHAKPTLRVINTARGQIVDEDALADAVAEGRIAGAALDVFAAEPTVKSPLFELERVVVTPHLGASTIEAQDKAGQTIAEQVLLAMQGDFVPFAVNVAASEASETVRPFLTLAETLGRLFSALAGGVSGRLDIAYEGQIGEYDCRVLTLAALKGLFAGVASEPVSYVNAPQLAAERGVEVRETTSTSARDYVNLVSIRGQVDGRDVHVAGTMAGQKRRIVGINEHTVDVPPARHMLVVRNADKPGMIALVAKALGDARINISDMQVGKNPAGEAALMVLTTNELVSPDVVAQIAAGDGISDVKAIELDG